ncbi:MAG: hypothetical protein E6X17_00770 [Sporomusaceae bacterium]|nr:hypothetical protein [Sporomusaceae bacterium]
MGLDAVFGLRAVGGDEGRENGGRGLRARQEPEGAAGVGLGRL